MPAAKGSTRTPLGPKVKVLFFCWPIPIFCSQKLETLFICYWYCGHFFGFIIAFLGHWSLTKLYKVGYRILVAQIWYISLFILLWWRPMVRICVKDNLHVFFASSSAWTHFKHLPLLVFLPYVCLYQAVSATVQRSVVAYAGSLESTNNV